MAVTARSPPQLETSVTPSLTHSEMVTMEKGILLPQQRMDGADRTNTHHSQKSKRYLGEAGVAPEPTKLRPVNTKCFKNVCFRLRE